jgi:nucleotide-binding universal stress UspA family protein
MSIVCLLDLERGGVHVAMVSALLANRMKTACHLALSTHEPKGSAPHHARAMWAAASLAEKAERIRVLVRDVHTHVLSEPSESEVSALANKLAAQVIVLAATAGEHGRADLLAQHARVPVLVVRDEAPFVRWASALSPLRIVAAVAGATDIPPVVRMLRRISDAGRCELVLVHVANDGDALASERIRELLRREGADEQWSLQVEPRRGPRAAQLVALAHAMDAQLIVTGSRAMARVSRLWDRSSSRSMLVQAHCSVLCVPIGAARERRPLHRVLAATDLTPNGDAALALASRVVAPGGVVHVVHVLALGHPDPTGQALARLGASVQALKSHGPSWKLHVLRGDAVATTLSQAARRLDVDAVCLASRSAAAGSLSATVAQLMAEIDCALLFAAH